MLDIFQMKDLARALGVVLSILCMHSAGPARHHSSQTKRILVLGDSLSEGFGLRQSEAYPALLIDKLRTAGLSFEVTNASASGGTTEGGLRRLPPHLKHKIDIFILELGINDAFRGVPIDKIRSNLQEIIDQVKQRNSNAGIIIA